MKGCPGEGVRCPGAHGWGPADIPDPQDEAARWLVVRRGRLRIVAKLCPGRSLLPLDRPGTGLLAASSPGGVIEEDVAAMPATSLAVIGT